MVEADIPNSLWINFRPTDIALRWHIITSNVVAYGQHYKPEVTYECAGSLKMMIADSYVNWMNKAIYY